MPSRVPPPQPTHPRGQGFVSGSRFVQAAFMGRGAPTPPSPTAHTRNPSQGPTPLYSKPTRLGARAWPPAPGSLAGLLSGPRPPLSGQAGRALGPSPRSTEARPSPPPGLTSPGANPSELTEPLTAPKPRDTPPRACSEAPLPPGAHSQALAPRPCRTQASGSGDTPLGRPFSSAASQDGLC